MSPTATLDHDTIRLSDSVRVTLAVEGDPPMRVVLPKEPLDEVTSAVWRAQPVGSPRIDALPDGRQKWSFTYRVDPYAPGDAVPLAFAPARLFVGTDPQPRNVQWPPLVVRVVSGARGDVATEARPVTGVEAVPESVGSVLPTAGWLILPLVGLLVILVVVLRGSRRRPLPPVPLNQATAALDALAVADLTADVFAIRLTDILRKYIERTSTIPAITLTGTELATAVEAAGGRPVELVASLATALAAGDVAKYAGTPLPDATRREMIEAARRFVTWAPPPQTNSEEPPPCDPTPPAAGS